MKLPRAAWAALALLVLAIAGTVFGAAYEGAPAGTLDAASSAGERSAKPEAPLDIRIKRPRGARIGRPFTLAITVVARAAASPLTLTVKPLGVVKRRGRGGRRARWERVAAGSARRMDARLICRRRGAGTVVVTGRLRSGGGGVQTRMLLVDVLAAGDEVLAGAGGMQQLQLEHLDHALAAGDIDRAEYERRRAIVLGGGATESS